MGLKVRIDRSAAPGSFRFASLFKGFEGVGAVRKIFGDQTEAILDELIVEVTEGRGYLRINDGSGSIMVNSNYLKEGPDLYLYLDVIHELVHIRQHREGKELWDRNYSYVDRPTEIEAYKVTVEEAKRVGLERAELADYLRVEWVSEEEFSRLLVTLGVAP